MKGIKKRRTFISVSKEGNGVNEDSVICHDNRIAVSDGAGGGGVYADRWSDYLVKNLPEKPILSFEQLDQWIESIWESFYNDCETEAMKEGGMLLDKFYDEGAFATLAAAWKYNDSEWRWIAYGDSVIFHYNFKIKQLEHSFTSLYDFNKPPYLINCKDDLNEDGFRSGNFHTDNDSIVFVASDALSHYILMMYEVFNSDLYSDDLQQALNANSKNVSFIRNAQEIKKGAFENVLGKLIGACSNKANFFRHINAVQRRGLLAFDDYTFVYKKNK